MGLIEGVALLADQVVEFTRRQALGGGQRFQAEYPVVDALAAGGLEQLRHPAGGGELGLVAQVLIVELAGERVGVCGRTGSGKSSLSKCLFGLVPFDGEIFVGGRAATQMSLSALRSSLVLVQQVSELI